MGHPAWNSVKPDVCHRPTATINPYSPGMKPMNIHLKPTPRTPGAWMRIKLVKRYLLTIVVASLGLGAIILWLALTTIPGPSSTIVNATLLVWMVGVAASLLFAKYGFKNYRSSYLEKGLAAETLIGKRIEAAITFPNYAVAHNVQIEAETPSGDIDHLVATPEGIVVVESKFKDLPSKQVQRGEKPARRCHQGGPSMGAQGHLGARGNRLHAPEPRGARIPNLGRGHSRL